VIYWITWGLVIALYLAWPLTHLKMYKWTNDEGLHLQEAALANAGYPLYTETAFNKPPLLIWILRAAFRLAGTTMAAGRLAILCLNLLGFVATGAIARQLWGKWAGVATTAILLALPELPVRAHVVMAGLPPMSFTLIAVAAAMAFQYRRRRRWIFLSGTALIGALLIHPLHIYSTVPLAVVLFLPGLVLPADELRRAGWWDVFFFLAPMAVAGLTTLMAVDRQSFFSWVLQSNYEAVMQVPLDENWRMVVSFFKNSWALIGLSIVSSAVLSRSPKRRRALLLLAIWWLAMLGTLLALTPLWRQYLIFLAFPLTIVSGGGVVAVCRQLLRSNPKDGNRRRERLNALLAALMLIGLIAFGVDRWEKTRPRLLDGPEWSPELLAARAFIEAAVSPDSFVTTDDALLAFAAGRLVPPPFTEASKKQIELGNFTTEDAVEGMLRYGTQAALFGTGRLTRLPGFQKWIDDVAAERRHYGDMRAYRLDLPRHDPVSTIARFENGMELQGYALSHGELHPGDRLTVMLFWGRANDVPVDSHVFVHLVHEDGGLWAQHDGPLLDDATLSGNWEESKRFFETHELGLGSEAPPGEYSLTVGMYPWPSHKRTPAYRPDGSRWPQDRAVIERLSVTPR
jgi:hypothetical protein